MTRNLKALGLAVMATLALGAVFASGASAQVGVLTADEDFTLTGTEQGAASENAFTAFGSSVNCDSTYAGHKYNETPHEFIPATGESTVTITPDYKNCESSEGESREVILNGCDFVFHIGVTTQGKHTYAAKADVVCPPGEVIEILGGPCVVTVGPQAGLEGPHFTHTTEPASDIDLEGSFTGIHAEACGGLATTNEAELHTNVTIEAHDTLEQPIEVTISH